MTTNTFNLWAKFSFIEKEIMFSGILGFILIGYMNWGQTEYQALIPRGLPFAVILIIGLPLLSVFYNMYLGHKPNTHTLYQPGNVPTLLSKKVLVGVSVVFIMHLVGMTNYEHLASFLLKIHRFLPSWSTAFWVILGIGCAIFVIWVFKVNDELDEKARRKRIREIDTYRSTITLMFGNSSHTEKVQKLTHLLTLDYVYINEVKYLVYDLNRDLLKHNPEFANSEEFKGFLEKAEGVIKRRTENAIR